MAKSPGLLTLEFWSLKRIVFVLGFIVAMAGTTGQFIFVEPLKREADKADRTLRQTTEAIATLQNSYFAHYFAAQQGAIIFALDPRGTTHNRELLGNLYKANLLDRAIPFRYILANLALAKEIDYTKAHTDYVALNDRARADLNPASYRALKEFEDQQIQRAMDRTSALIRQRVTDTDQKAAADKRIEDRRYLLAVIAAIGTILMLAANLTMAR